MTSRRTLDLQPARTGQPAVRANNNRNNASLPRAGD
jgi:hypothetical protein